MRRHAQMAELNRRESRVMPIEAAGDRRLCATEQIEAAQSINRAHKQCFAIGGAQRRVEAMIGVDESEMLEEDADQRGARRLDRSPTNNNDIGDQAADRRQKFASPPQFAPTRLSA